MLPCICVEVETVHFNVSIPKSLVPLVLHAPKNSFPIKVYASTEKQVIVSVYRWFCRVNNYRKRTLLASCDWSVRVLNRVSHEEVSLF